MRVADVDTVDSVWSVPPTLGGVAYEAKRADERLIENRRSDRRPGRWRIGKGNGRKQPDKSGGVNDSRPPS